MESSSIHILVIDDDDDLIDLMRRSLTNIGNFTVHIAMDGVSGLEQFYAVRPRCAIIDVKMPGLNGFQLVRTLRGDPETAGTPLIILTALATERDRLEGLISGADFYLTKPITPQDLAAAVHTAITRTEQDRLASQIALTEVTLPDEGGKHHG